MIAKEDLISNLLNVPKYVKQNGESYLGGYVHQITVEKKEFP